VAAAQTKSTPEIAARRIHNIDRDPDMGPENLWIIRKAPPCLQIGTAQRTIRPPADHCQPA
jgi:hypothetical protein